MGRCRCTTGKLLCTTNDLRCRCTTGKLRCTTNDLRCRSTTGMLRCTTNDLRCRSTTGVLRCTTNDLHCRCTTGNLRRSSCCTGCCACCTCGGPQEEPAEGCQAGQEGLLLDRNTCSWELLNPPRMVILALLACVSCNAARTAVHDFVFAGILQQLRLFV